MFAAWVVAMGNGLAYLVMNGATEVVLTLVVTGMCLFLTGNQSFVAMENIPDVVKLTVAVIQKLKLISVGKIFHVVNFFFNFFNRHFLWKFS